MTLVRLVSVGSTLVRLVSVGLILVKLVILVSAGIIEFIIVSVDVTIECVQMLVLIVSSTELHELCG